MLIDLEVKQFLKETASPTPVPGGGSVSALAGALAAGLSAMVAGLSIGKKGYEDRREQMQSLREEANVFRDELMHGVDRDGMAYEKFLAALRLPKHTEAEKAARQKSLQAARKEICRVPLGVARNALGVLELAGNALKMGRKDVVTDSAVAILLARAAVRGALFNVRFNLRGLKDDTVRETLHQVEQMEQEVERKEASLLKTVGL